MVGPQVGKLQGFLKGTKETAGSHGCGSFSQAACWPKVDWHKDIMESRPACLQCVTCVCRKSMGGERSHILEQCVMCVCAERAGREESHTRTVCDVCVQKEQGRERGVTY